MVGLAVMNSFVSSKVVKESGLIYNGLGIYVITYVTRVVDTTSPLHSAISFGIVNAVIKASAISSGVVNAVIKANAITFGLLNAVIKANAVSFGVVKALIKASAISFGIVNAVIKALSAFATRAKNA